MFILWKEERSRGIVLLGMGEVMRDVCIECEVYGDVSGIGLCWMCEEGVRDRELNEDESELLSEWRKGGLEVFEVKVLDY